MDRLVACGAARTQAQSDSAAWVTGAIYSRLKRAAFSPRDAGTCRLHRMHHVLAGWTLREALAGVLGVVLDEQFVLWNRFPALRAVAEGGGV